MLIECSRCGAPLDVATGAKIVRCNYCRSSHHIHATRTLAAQTPNDWRPPATWTPPQHGQYPAQPLKYQRTSATILVLAVVGAVLLVVVSAVGFFVMRAVSASRAAAAAGRAPSDTGTGTATAAAPDGASVPAAQLATAELELTQVAFQKQFPSAELDGERARVVLSGSAFESALLTWNPERTRIGRVDLLSSKGAVDVGAIGKALERQLKRQYVPGKQALGARYPDSSLTIDPASGQFIFRSEPPDGERTDWQGRGQVLWTLMRNVGLGAPLTVDPKAAQLLTGYALGEVASRIDANVLVDQAEARVTAALPGSVASQGIDLKLVVFLDHPWFGSLSLHWENERNGRLRTLQLWNPAHRDNLADREAIAACLEPVLGKAKVTITDHLKQERLYQWNLQTHYTDGGNITANNVWLRLPPDATAAARFKAILNALSGCGRP